jgi:hypothetical protein
MDGVVTRLSAAGGQYQIPPRRAEFGTAGGLKRKGVLYEKVFGYSSGSGTVEPRNGAAFRVVCSQLFTIVRSLVMKKSICCLAAGLVFIGALYCQETPFEGKWSAKSPMPVFFDTLEYTFRGNTWTLTKLKNGRAAEISDGTFTYTRDRLIMQQQRYKTTGDWKELQMSTGASYKLSGNMLSLDGIEFTRIGGRGNSQTNATSDAGSIGGLYYSIALPKGWAETSSHKYLPILEKAMGMDTAQGDFTNKAFVDRNNENNFLLISEIPVPSGLTMAQITNGIPVKRTIIKGREFYIQEEPFTASSTMKVAYIIYKNIMHSFWFILENPSLNVADQVFSSIQLK